MSNEHRGHTRIECELPCIVDGKTHGRIRNLSLGGALVRSPSVDARIDDKLTMEFPTGDADPVLVTGDVVRIIDLGNDMYAEYGIRLDPDPVPIERFFRHIDHMLTGKGGGSRNTPRLHRRVPLRCRTTEVFPAMMNNVSRGGLGMECIYSVAVGEKVLVEFRVAEGDGPLELPGFVTHVVPTFGHNRVGICFSPLSPSEVERLEQLLQLMLRGL